MIKQIGRYEVLHELAQGAMGMVYQAKDPLIERIVAIKTISLAIAEDEREEYEARFYQEAKAAGRLSHPNIVTIYDVGKSGDLAYIAMEFLEGHELRDIMNQYPHSIVPVSRALDIVIQVAQGMAYAHQHGIVHRDIKPSNIMVDEDGHVKITDFGIARMSSSSVRTQVGMVLGSPKYMSPEQVLGKQLDQRSDIFSLGVMLYEMITGRAPFSGDNVNAIMYQTLNTIPIKPSTINPAVPDMMNFIIAKALAKRLDERYQTAKELVSDLRQCAELLPTLSQQIMTPAVSKSVAQAISKPVRQPSVEEIKSGSTSGLSPKFDSSEATMRLASMTASKEDVDELSKTLKVAARAETPSEVKVDKPAAKVIRPQPNLFRTTEPDKFTAPQQTAKPKPIVAIAIGVAVLLLLIILAYLFI